MSDLEKRKAKTLEDISNLDMVDSISTFAFVKRHKETLQELLQPMPTDDEVEEAVSIIKEQGFDRWGVNSIPNSPAPVADAVNTLIRRAKQPSCDGLVEALEEEKKKWHDCYRITVKVHNECRKENTALRKELEEHKASKAELPDGELKSCKCGHTVSTGSVIVGVSSRWYIVSCYNCGNDIDLMPTEETAIKAWNERV